VLHPEAPLILRAFLAVHIAAGTLARFVVPLVMAVRKGGTIHRRFGRVFVYSMFVVAATALVCGPYFHDYFLVLIAVFSSYLTFVGWRALKRKDPARTPAAPLDWAAAALATAAGATMIALGELQRAQFGSFSLVLFALGAICTGAGVRSIVRFVRPPRARAAWLFEHFGQLLAAYIATVSAFSAVNFHFIQPVWLRWLWPTVVGTIVITAYMTHYKIRIARGVALRRLVVIADAA